MDILMKTVLLGIIFMLMWKLLAKLFRFRELCRKLRKIPQKSSHWLKGNANEVRGLALIFHKKGEKK
jgi:hypothetical protein